jgi:hypothetical protein
VASALASVPVWEQESAQVWVPASAAASVPEWARGSVQVWVQESAPAWAPEWVRAWAPVSARAWVVASARAWVQVWAEESVPAWRWAPRWQAAASARLALEDRHHHHRRRRVPVRSWWPTALEVRGDDVRWAPCTSSWCGVLARLRNDLRPTRRHMLEGWVKVIMCSRTPLFIAFRGA